MPGINALKVARPAPPRPGFTYRVAAALVLGASLNRAARPVVQVGTMVNTFKLLTSGGELSGNFKGDYSQRAGVVVIGPGEQVRPSSSYKKSPASTPRALLSSLSHAAAALPVPELPLVLCLPPYSARGRSGLVLLRA